MTTHDERRRNLIWGRELLAELSQDAGVPLEWRIQAGALLNAYPALERLKDADTNALETLREDFSEVLCEAGLLFMRLRMHPSSNEQRQHSLFVLLRHFG